MTYHRVNRHAALLLATLMPALFAGVAGAHSPAEEMAEAATRFLAALTPEQKAQAVFDLKDPERMNWGFVPKPRKGLPIKEMTPAQRPLAMGLLSAGLSHRGYLKAMTIMSLEQVLLELEAGTKHPVRDPELYYFSIFGKPEATGTWGWRVEGHHISVNFTIAGGKAVASAPSFFGANPAEVRQGPRQGLRVLGVEEDLGRQLVKSLSASQQQAAVITNVAFKDILTGAERKVGPLAPAGLPAAQMNEAQQRLLQQLVREYAGRHRAELASQDLEMIEAAGWGKVAFAWAGGFEKGEGHYYRVQGPTFLLEYDNTQSQNNHIHSVWRDFAGDFGEDLLRKHYEESPHGK